MRVIVTGSGIFGVTAARALSRRGHAVFLLDPGPLPHPLAASTDLSKVVRLEYGADQLYTAAMARALAGFRAWNIEFGKTYFHETGVLFTTRQNLLPGSFEYDSLQCVGGRGHPIAQLSETEIAVRFPAWNSARYPHAIFDREGGWVESGALVARLIEAARADGVTLIETQVTKLRQDGRRITGVFDAHGVAHAADHVVFAGGAWTHHVLPELRGAFRSVGMPVFHLAPRQPRDFAADRFPVFGADISRTGYYGFPLHPTAGVVKIANHGIGREMHPESSERAVTPAEVAHLRAFVADTFPGLVDAELVYTRVCLYSDTRDGHFWIANDPTRDGLTVAAGGSGHAFKFAPLLGDWTADAVEGRTSQELERFRWRTDQFQVRAEEAARCWAPT